MRYVVEPVRPQKWICEENQRGEMLFSFFSNREILTHVDMAHIGQMEQWPLSS